MNWTKDKIIAIADEIIAGRRLDASDDLSFLTEGELNDLTSQADRIRRELHGSHVDLCTIINGKAGRCSEDCKFCAQSSHYDTCADHHEFVEEERIISECKAHADAGAHRFSIVTAGRTLSEEDLAKAVSAYGRMHRECSGISLCASHGLLDEEQFRQLKEAGVTRYHANIETSRSNFTNICTTHTYDQKIEVIKAAQCAGLNVCSGGIIGMGESWNDRIEMALDLAALRVVSIPINILRPIPGTPFEDLEPIGEAEILRTIALFRFIVPDADIRLAAGRNMMADNGLQAFFSGANATITGDMLTTSGNNTEEDKKMLSDHGFDITGRAG